MEKYEKLINQVYDIFDEADSQMSHEELCSFVNIVIDYLDMLERFKRSLEPKIKSKKGN